MSIATNPTRRGSALITATKKYATEDRRQSWWHFWSTLGALVVSWILTCLDMPWPLRATATLVTGLILVRLFIIYHDYLHGTILSGSRLAKAILAGYGLLALSPCSVWKRTHDHHHKNNTKVFGAGIGTYPLMTTTTYANAPWRKRAGYAMARHPLTILLGYLTVFLYGMCIRPLLADARHHFDVVLALVIQLGIIVALALTAPYLLIWTFPGPLLIASAVGAYLFFAQHNFPGMQMQSGADWDYVFAALNSSSFIAMNPIMHWFTGNIGYHHVHHLNAHIPFYRLPEAMAAITELQSPKTTSLSPVAIYSCLRLKLWNSQKSCLVTFSGL